MEDLTIRHRNRLRHHYTQTSNVLLFGYQSVSDGAKLTYQVIDSFDWTDAAGLRKGFAHPSLRRLAEIRGLEKRTVRRHIAELERARLIARDERPGKPSLLVIEDPSEEETRRYLQVFDRQGEDNTVLPTPDKIIRPYKKEERKERQNLVNEEQALSAVGEPGNRPTDQDSRARREYLAQEIVNVLKDHHSLGYYRKVAETIPPQRIFEALSTVKLLAREGRIRRKAAVFVTMMERARMNKPIQRKGESLHAS